MNSFFYFAASCTHTPSATHARHDGMTPVFFKLCPCEIPPKELELL